MGSMPGAEFARHGYSYGLFTYVQTDVEERYEEYEEAASRGEIQLSKRLPAKILWRKMLTMLFETGHPWITFKDACNIRSPQDHVGVIHSSNLCTEITLNTSAKETAVCNLGSVNLARHVRSGNQILVIGFVDGLETGDVQEMSEVTDAPLNCGQNLS